MSRRIGRILAFQALYSWEAVHFRKDEPLSFSWIEPVGEDGAPEPDEELPIFKELLAKFNAFAPERKQETFDFARHLVSGTLENREEIDGIIKKHLSSAWRLERINKAALAVIRLSVYSLLYQKETAPTVVIDEAVEIIKDYGTNDSYKFTNAILDNIRKDLADK
ncbi:MAG: transcription antitermination factor NusB [Treponema sp.]